MPQFLKNLFKRIRVFFFGFKVDDLVRMCDCSFWQSWFGEVGKVMQYDKYEGTMRVKNLRTGSLSTWRNTTKYFELYFGNVLNFNNSKKEVKCMKLRIYDAAAASRNGHLSGIVRIRLIRDNPQTIGLYAVNHLGEKVDSGALLKINADGSIVRCPGVNSRLGLSLEAPGQLKLS